MAEGSNNPIFTLFLIGLGLLTINYLAQRTLPKRN